LYSDVLGIVGVFSCRMHLLVLQLRML